MRFVPAWLAPWPVVGVRAALVAGGIVVWYWSQAVLGQAGAEGRPTTCR